MALLLKNSTVFSKRSTTEVNIGGIPLGGKYPVRIQSMANTQTGDVTSSVNQCIRIIDAGADYVRFTVPSLEDVNAFSGIRTGLRHKGYRTPLIADVHFNPDIAIKVADYADKVRVNPGNFHDPNKFRLLVEKCREHGVAIRVGVNHGSLSERIMDKFGDTEEGMAESAMEFLHICRELNFNQVVVSMKASNVRVMIYATRLVAAMMQKENMNFPLHLGVTEAGEGEDGRIKSAVGIGTLLCEGMGDTIRVSLTEEPELEIPVARKIIEFAAGQMGAEAMDNIKSTTSRYIFTSRKTRSCGNIGGSNLPVVIGYDTIDPSVNLICVRGSEISASLLSDVMLDKKAVILYLPVTGNVRAELAFLHCWLEENNCDVPVVFQLDIEEKNAHDFMVKCAVSLGGAFIDGFGDGILLKNKFELGQDVLNITALGILQACRVRMSRTEFISCPSCGRTNFNLMETLSRIKAATAHLKGLKIGIMGCIVNGPGEMADADYGYVGAGKGKINLYKARAIVKKGIPEEYAVEELISLIRENGDWKENE
jgi:(E)-4-hydroxy-3-methylbut-2-enyl-diphosphate synthase